MALFFVLAFPLLLIAMARLRLPGGEPTLILGVALSVSVAMGSFAGLAINLASAIEKGILTRVYVTPMSLAVHLGARLLAPSAVIFLALLAILFTVHTFYGLPVGSAQLARLILAMALGMVAFGALGLGLGSLAKRANTASFLTQLVLFPLVLAEAVALGKLGGGKAVGWLELLLFVSPLHALANLSSAQSATGAIFSVVSLMFWTAIGLLYGAKRIRSVL